MTICLNMSVFFGSGNVRTESYYAQLARKLDQNQGKKKKKNLSYGPGSQMTCLKGGGEKGRQCTHISAQNFPCHPKKNKKSTAELWKNTERLRFLIGIYLKFHQESTLCSSLGFEVVFSRDLHDHHSKFGPPYTRSLLFCYT